jgi:hypothetical protein
LGELIASDLTGPVIVMTDTRRLRVRAFVEELDAPTVSVGMTATIRADGLPDNEFTGRVAETSPRMSRKILLSDRPDERFDTKVREVCIDVDGGESLVVGLRVDVTIDTTASSPRECAVEENADAETALPIAQRQRASL